MKKADPTALLILLLAGAASAGEIGIINQAGPYEATMKFYLHPAHGFPGTAGTTPATTGFVSEVANSAQSAKIATSFGKMSAQSGKMVAARSRHEPPKTRVSADLQFDP